MRIEILAEAFTVCKTAGRPADIPMSFTARTHEERSLVCPTEYVPADTTAREDGWRGMRVAGQLEFSLIGILARIADALAAAGISIFAVSTYDTDYVFIRQDRLDDAVTALRNAGFEIGG